MRCKKCIKFLTFFITLVLSFVLFSNDTSAVYKVYSTADVTKVTIRDVNAQANTEYTAVNHTFVSVPTLSLGSSGVRLAFNKLTLDRDFQLSYTRHAKFDVYVRFHSEYTNIFNSFNCPIGSNVRVSSCSIEQLNTAFDTISFSRFASPSSGVMEYFETNNDGYQFFVFHIDVYYPSDDLTTVNELTFQNRAQVNSIWEYGSVLSQNLKIDYGFTFVSSYEDQTAEEEMNEKDDEDRSNLESQSSDTDSASESSSEDAESTGTTLLGAFSAFVTALTNASPSNCNLDMDLGNLDLGVVNLCQLSPPQPIPTIASIFLILFCVPLSIATAKKVINLFRSFQ